MCAGMHRHACTGVCRSAVTCDSDAVRAPVTLATLPWIHLLEVREEGGRKLGGAPSLYLHIYISAHVACDVFHMVCIYTYVFTRTCTCLCISICLHTSDAWASTAERYARQAKKAVFMTAKVLGWRRSVGVVQGAGVGGL